MPNNQAQLVGVNAFESAMSVAGQFTTSAGLVRNVTTVAAATYDLLATDDIVLVDYTTTGAVTSFTLPTAQVADGRTFVVMDVDGNAGTNNITLDTEGSEKINGADTFVMATDSQAITVTCDGTNWFVIAN